MRRLMRGLVIAFALSTAGCSASSYLNGARFAERDFAAESTRAFDAEGCGIIDPSLVAENQAKERRNAEKAARPPAPTTVTSRTWTTQGCGVEKYCQVETTTTTAPAGAERIFTGVTQNSYHVVAQGALFERPPADQYRSDSGLLVENRWTADDGDHFFTWVKATGWEYIIPKEAGQVGSRLVYKKLEKETHPDGTTRPRGIPVARCDLVPRP